MRIRAPYPLLAILAILIPNPAEAAGGAYVVDDPIIGAVGDCQVETWAAFASDGDDVIVSQPACVANLGTPVEISVIGQSVRTDEWTAIGGLQAKTVLLPVKPRRMGLALTVGTTVDLSSGESALTYINVPAAVHFGEHLRLNLNAGWSLDGLTDVHHATWGAGFEWDFATSLMLIGEVFGQAGRDDDHDPHVQAGIRYSPTTDIDCDLIYGDNVAGEHAQWLTTGLTVRF